MLPTKVVILRAVSLQQYAGIAQLVERLIRNQ